MKKRRPNTKTIQRVLQWLQEHSLSVYGPNINADTGNEYGGCRDYTTAEDIVKVARLIEKGETKEVDE